MFVYSLTFWGKNVFFLIGLTSKMKGAFIVSLKLKDGEISSVLVSNNIVLQDSGLLYWQVKKNLEEKRNLY